MDRRFHYAEDPTTTPENGPDSPVSGDDTAVTNEPSPKKSRKSSSSVEKRVVTVPVGEVDGVTRSKGGEVSPPSDSWSWRKYGQKPIKGSPYPRGYYRCSSSKGCPARKQVERSRLDPTSLLITYSSHHNHAAANANANAKAKLTPQHQAVIQPNIEPPDDPCSFAELAYEFGWFADGGYTSAALLDGSAFVGPALDDADVAVMLSMSIREEDQPLFGDLGELPECSVVFRRSHVDRRHCGVGTPCGGSTR